MSVAFLCSGQGCQSVGMGLDVFAGSAAAAEVLAAAEAASGVAVGALLEAGPVEELSKSCNVQPCLSAVSLGIAAALREAGVEPDCVAGFSLGEYPAHAIAGTVSVEQMFALVAERGRRMGEAAAATPGKMAALLRCTPEQAAELCAAHAGEAILAPANLNCPGQVVISGEAGALDAACEAWAADGGRFSLIKTEGAFHTPLMQAAADGLLPALEKAQVSEPKLPIFCNLTAEPLAAAADIPASLHAQITNPVRWEQTIRNMIAAGVDTFIECGPGKVLAGMVKRTARDAGANVRILAAESMDQILEIAKELQHA